ncbi:hypothetical protein AKJ53_01280 [candidate division MSBL1 archaeon SCGC-AAA382F02]|uniref:TIGR00267 family protein n=1 Tax=candidate division MSBL1 archaeon SCGC-AAA382F02 TaxID=1698282 RepID=A0A133VI63_9EURY|nr:hypothetical protein AKJ53_01280 [candidate division MSBL1 archaeon SCGC-AAA382F02]
MDRYFVRGFIDGLLSTLGIVIGASTAIGASAEATQIIIAAGIGGGVANGLSNVLGAFMGEKAAMGKEFEKVEKALLKEEALRGTKVDEKFRGKIISSGVMDGLATIGGAIVPVLPFLLISILAVSEITALYIAIVVSLAIFFLLGGYIGKVSKENFVLAGLKMAAFGGVTAIVVTLIRLAL